jgi:Spy/CpxP family protein refolding chaperone
MTKTPGSPVTRRLTLLVAALLLPLAAVAIPIPERPGDRHPFPGGPRFGPPGGGRGAFLDRIADYLDLSAEQRTQAKAKMESTRDSATELGEQTRGLRDELRAAVDRGDKAAIGDLVLQLKALRDQAGGVRDRVAADLETILTPQQQVRWQALRDWLDQRRDERREHGRWGGFGDRRERRHDD